MEDGGCRLPSQRFIYVIYWEVNPGQVVLRINANIVRTSCVVKVGPLATPALHISGLNSRQELAQLAGRSPADVVRLSRAWRPSDRRAWTIYRFLLQRHSELDGETVLDARGKAQRFA